jgi:hypothetical protein
MAIEAHTYTVENDVLAATHEAGLQLFAHDDAPKNSSAAKPTPRKIASR